jgi:hypothetical protein
MPYNNAMAKPKLPAGEARDVLKALRFTAQEDQELREVTEKTGFSEWARETLLRAARRKRQAPRRRK